MNILSPFSSNYHAWKDLIAHTKSELTKKNFGSRIKAVSVATGILSLSVLVGLLSFGVGGVALFRTLVGRLGPINPQSSAYSSSQKVGQAAQGISVVKEGSSQPQLSNLSKEISYLEEHGNSHQKKKAPLFKQALDRFAQQGLKSKLKTARLKDATQFELSKAAHFNQKFVSRGESWKIESTPEFFDYLPTPGSKDYWVDFANASLGGGCFTSGFVQEEVMVAEMPDFADHIAANLVRGHCSLSTRDGQNFSTREEAGKGNPNPYLIEGVHRVQKVDNARAYGGKVYSLSNEELLSSTLEVKPAQVVNLLAIAAPRLESRDPKKQWDASNLKDIYNTIVAGITLVQEQSAGQPVVIHSGKLGCGAFNNSTEAVYLLHRLASHQHKAKIKLHGYEQIEVDAYEAKWQKLSLQFQGKTGEECLEIISKSAA